MSWADEIRLMTRIAQMYHVEGLKQTEIAKQLNISQARASRLLKRAVDEGIVKVIINPPAGIFAETEARLRERYGLRQAIVADSSEEREEMLLAAMGAAAAHYLETTLVERDVIGISSWSTSLLRMVDSLAPIRRARAAGVIQILGGIGNPGVQSHASHLVTRLATLCGGTPRFLPAQGVTGSAEARGVLLSDPFVQDTLAHFKDVTLALVGIGSLMPSKMLENSGNSFTRSEIDDLAERGAVGDICLRFLDAAGEKVRTPLDDRVIGMSLEEIKAVARVVAVAGGRRKVAAIRGALLGGYVDVLITDRFTADRLLADEARA